MSKYRKISASIAIGAVMVMVLSSVVAAHNGHHRHRFDNVFHGTQQADSFEAAPGDRDLIIGRAGGDKLDGGDLHDHIHGGFGADTIYGGENGDWIRGGPGGDTIMGEEGRDLIKGGFGDDEIDGGNGIDRIFGGPGADTITGGPNHDLIRAGFGDDTVYGQDGVRDFISCGPGNDSFTADDVDRVAANCENDITPAP